MLNQINPGVGENFAAMNNILGSKRPKKIEEAILHIAKRMDAQNEHEKNLRELGDDFADDLDSAINLFKGHIYMNLKEALILSELVKI